MKRIDLPKSADSQNAPSYTNSVVLGIPRGFVSRWNQEVCLCS